MTGKQLTEYFRHVMELESSIRCQEQIRDQWVFLPNGFGGEDRFGRRATSFEDRRGTVAYPWQSAHYRTRIRVEDR